MNAGAASEIFDHATGYTRREFRNLLTRAASRDRFTIREISAAGSYANAGRLLRVLFREGHLKRVNPPATTPVVYEWVAP